MLDTLLSFAYSHPILFNTAIAIISLIILAKAADLLVYSITHYAKLLGISEYLIGFVVLAIGTALPELMASITGAMLGSGEIVYGTILGSNLAKIPLLGLVLLLGFTLSKKESAGSDAPVLTLVLALLPIILVIDGLLSRIDGIVLLAAFAIYIGSLWQGEQKFGRMKKKVALKTVYKDMIIFIGALAALLLSARFLVSSSLHISALLDISPFIIGIVVIGIGGSMPEITVQLRSVYRRHKDLVFGNILGSIVANSTFVLGIVSLVHPVPIAFPSLLLTSIFLFAGLVYTLMVIRHGQLNWKHGLIMVIFYAVFLLLELLREL
ncbi:sodium:calcium antiporter [Candidatus Woesearchaeota archaeon]|nr:sodium:calcium antiporter [Candidatus Woesearchaeota archaeon]